MALDDFNKSTNSFKKRLVKYEGGTWIAELFVLMELTDTELKRVTFAAQAQGWAD